MTCPYHRQAEYTTMFPPSTVTVTLRNSGGCVCPTPAEERLYCNTENYTRCPILNRVEA